ncbi:MAG: ATP synthase F1 subunit delta [Candidatus Babeliales bacterium]|nr:ATP synthase F1 subunit delta [Candidatus Babeliales bacterium]
MIVDQSVITKKYANAFLNVFIDQISSQTMQQVCLLGDFLVSNHLLLSFLQWPVLSSEVKIKALKELMHKFSLGSPFERLIILLADQKRSYLIGDVLKHICALYAERKNILNFTIESSHDLTADECLVIAQFLANITGASIIYDYKVNKNLIAGIRLQSDTYLWQYSIRTQLDTMKLPLIR